MQDKNAKKSKKGIKTVFTFFKKGGIIIMYVLNKAPLIVKSSKSKGVKNGFSRKREFLKIT